MAIDTKLKGTRLASGYYEYLLPSLYSKQLDTYSVGYYGRDKWLWRYDNDPNICGDWVSTKVEAVAALAAYIEYITSL